MSEHNEEITDDQFDLFNPALECYTDTKKAKVALEKQLEKINTEIKNIQSQSQNTETDVLLRILMKKKIVTLNCVSKVKEQAEILGFKLAKFIRSDENRPLPRTLSVQSCEICHVSLYNKKIFYCKKGLHGICEECKVKKENVNAECTCGKYIARNILAEDEIRKQVIRKKIAKADKAELKEFLVANGGISTQGIEILISIEDGTTFLTVL